MKKAKRVKVLAYAKFQTIIMTLIGLVAGLLYSVGGMIIDLQTIGWNDGTTLAFLAILGMPLYFAAFGLFSGIVGAWLYNLAAKWLGNVEVNFERH